MSTFRYVFCVFVLSTICTKMDMFFISRFKLSFFLAYLNFIKKNPRIFFINFAITVLFCVSCNIDITSCVIKLKCWF